MGFLDNTGLTRFLNDIKSKFTAPKSIAYVESTTAKTNHAAGDHFMIGEQLKRATSAIATGETIGTSNSADDTVQAQIDTLRDSVTFRDFSAGKISYGAGTVGTRAYQHTVDCTLNGYAPIAVSVRHIDNSAAHEILAFIGTNNNGATWTLRINFYRCLSTAFTSSAVLADAIARVVYLKV